MATEPTIKRNSKQKLTPAQIEARRATARARMEKQEEARARKEKAKQIFTVIICLILVLALGLPTIGLSLLGPGLFGA